MARANLHILLLLAGTCVLSAADWTKRADAQESELTAPAKARLLAKAKFEAVHSDPEKVQRERLGLAWLQYEGVEELQQIGRDLIVSYYELFFAAGKNIIEAELALCHYPSERAACLEWLWAEAWRKERIDRARYEAGRDRIEDYARGQAQRLETEMRYLRARDASGREEPIPLTSRTGKPDRTKDYAKAKFEALAADPRELARRRLEARHTEMAALFADLQAGRRTFILVLEPALEIRTARLEMASGDGNSRDFLKTFWEWAYHVDQLSQRLDDPGPIPNIDNKQTRYHRLNAALALNRAGEKAAAASGSLADLGALPLRPTERKAQARALEEDLRANPGRLARNLLAAIQLEIEARLSEFRIGRASVDFLIDAARHRLHTELAQGADPAAAQERYWNLLFEIDQISRRRFDAGRIGTEDYARTRFQFLGATLDWAEARRRAHQPTP
jgi:hypothetical protein